MITINEQKKIYINRKADEIRQLVVIQSSQSRSAGSVSSNVEGTYLKHKDFIDLGEIIGHMDESQKDDKRIRTKFRNFKDERVGYDENGFNEIYKLIAAILKEQSIQQLISQDFLVEKTFDWLINSYRNNLTSEVFSEFILMECQESIQEYNIYFPVLYLESDREFDLGKVRFQYLSEEYIKLLSLKIEENKRADYVQALKEYKGQLMANCTVKAEKEKAIELAVGQAKFSVDILKVLSPTVEFPNVQIFYDLDMYNIHQSGYKVIVQSRTEPEHIKINFSRKIIPFVIDKMVWDIMLRVGITDFHSFSLKTVTLHSELESLIRNAISNFAKAISNHDLHERIVLVFTVLESLLLPNDNAPIIDSLCKYLPKLITKDLEERTVTIKTIKAMYAVRSNMVHHAKRVDFDVIDLSKLQICTKALLSRLIELSPYKKTKQEVLQEVDDLIHRA